MVLALIMLVLPTAGVETMVAAAEEMEEVGVEVAEIREKGKERRRRKERGVVCTFVGYCALTLWSVGFGILMSLVILVIYTSMKSTTLFT